MSSGTGPQAEQAVGQPQPAWVRPATVLQWQNTEPLEYHQLLRGAPRYRWWKPVLALILGTIYYLTFQVALLVPVMGLYSTLNSGTSLNDLNDLVVPDTQNPWSIFAALASIALMIPAVWLALLSTGLTPIGRGWSVALRIRWRWIWRTVLPALAALFVMNTIGIIVSIGLEGAGAESSEIEMPDIDLSMALWSLLLVLLLVPIQATAEELVFRGIFMQSIGGWLGGVRAKNAVGAFVRGPWIPILLPAVLFGFSHMYDVWGWLAVTAMAVAAGWLAWRTGGLEAAISLHVVNNLVAFGFMAFAVGGETAQTSDSGGPGAFVGEIIGLALYCWWVDRDFRARDGRRSRIDLVQVKVPVAAQPAPMPVPQPQPTNPFPEQPQQPMYQPAPAPSPAPEPMPQPQPQPQPQNPQEPQQ